MTIYLLPFVLSLVVYLFLRDNHQQQSSDKPTFSLQIIILSARENYLKRQSIRRTWLRDVDSHSQLKINAKFVIGNRSCMVNPIYRDNLFDCKLKKPDESDQQQQAYQHHSKLWAQKMKHLDKKIEAEINSLQDILVVNVMDTYRNLPDKLLESLSLVLQQSHPTHILKTDDDCYLNVSNIIDFLKVHSHSNSSLFANFRKNWPVNKHGKYDDQLYSSPIYPHYPCGSGYILTQDVVHWLVLNRAWLRRYQGEDVSLGIWLAAINVKFMDDPRWLCGTETINLDDAFTIPQLKTQQIDFIHSRSKQPEN